MQLNANLALKAFAGIHIIYTSRQQSRRCVNRPAIVPDPDVVAATANNSLPAVGQVALEPAALQGRHTLISKLSSQGQGGRCRKTCPQTHTIMGWKQGQGNTQHPFSHELITGLQAASTQTFMQCPHECCACPAYFSPWASAAAFEDASGHTHSKPPASRVGKAVAQLRWLAHAVCSALGSRACGMLLQEPSDRNRNPW